MLHEVLWTLAQFLQEYTRILQLNVTVLLRGVNVEELMEPLPIFTPPVAVRHDGQGPVEAHAMARHNGQTIDDCHVLIIEHTYS